MCGIVGAYSRSGRVLDVAPLVAATDLLSHRGPDGGGYWSDGPFFLGHRRLSIIDLSPEGSQPMAAADHGLVISYNGELYNYPELRDELRARGHVFTTASDTEVLLRAYVEWREQMLGRLRGMFAFAIADTRDRSLFVARDRFGEKPLFVNETADRIAFASELRPLSALLRDRRVDDEALAGFLCFNYVPGDRSMLAGVERLSPGTWRRYAGGRTESGRYYDPGAVSVSVPERLEPTLDELRAHLDDATRIALRADVPVALFLSGGLDSSLTAESAVRQGHLKEAFCLDIAEKSYSEWDGASFVAGKLGLDLHRVVLGPDVLDDFESIVEHADDPLGDSSALAVWRLSKEASRSFKVVISGDGGDELLGGYLTYKATRIFSQTVDRAPATVRRALARWSSLVRPGAGKVTPAYKAMRFLRAAHLPSAEAHFTFNGSFMPDAATELVAGGPARVAASNAISAMRSRHRLPSRPRLRELQHADTTDYLPNDILTKVDRMTMAHGLESRAPLLDAKLADFALSAAGHYEGGLLAPPKRLFRELARRAFGPRVSSAKKQGFSIPVHTWLRGRSRSLVGDLLSRASLRAVPVLDGPAVERVRDRFLSGEQLGFEIWGMLVLVAWYRARIAEAPRLEATPSRTAHRAAATTLRRFEL
jgi:asparagine synthase (glutamine-hydrolysing)